MDVKQAIGNDFERAFSEIDTLLSVLPVQTPRSVPDKLRAGHDADIMGLVLHVCQNRLNVWGSLRDSIDIPTFEEEEYGAVIWVFAFIVRMGTSST